MRPLERGAEPTTAADWSGYRDAVEALGAAFGWTCSYCECPVWLAIHVEHKVPKVTHPELEMTWDNFLLACPLCNSIKGEREYAAHEHVWPDRDNTARAFVYEADGIVRVSPALSPELRELAQKTSLMVGLERLPGAGASQADARWRRRLEIWNMAERSRESLAANPSEELYVAIVDLARASGFWSVWMSVFAGDASVRQRFIDAFEGTSRSCFDRETRPIPRTGGLI